jgi:hypothetical protein
LFEPLFGQLLKADSRNSIYEILNSPGFVVEQEAERGGACLEDLTFGFPLVVVGKILEVVVSEQKGGLR